MKLNLDFYDKDMKFDKSVSLDESGAEMKKNLIRWYPFENGSSCLEIGAGEGELTEVLSDKCGNVTVVEFSKEKGDIIFEKYKDRENIEVIIGSLEKIKIEEKYDYILLIGILEYAKLFFKTENPYLDFIKYAKSKLKENGKILIGTDNSLGIKYFAGCKNNNFENIFDTITNKDGNSKLFTKTELEKILIESELQNYRFYYPLPSYKMPNVIFSDKYLPRNNNSKSMYNIWYEDDSNIIFNELEAIKNITKNGLFDIFANSFLIEAGTNNITNDIKFVSYNQLRKEEFRLMLTMNDDIAKKTNINDSSFNHIQKIKGNIDNLKGMGFNILENYDENTVQSNIFNTLTFDEYLVNLINENKIEEFFFKISAWFEYVKQKQTQNDNFLETLDNGLNILKKCYIDLVFENTVLNNDEEYVFYDQEWVLENMAVEFILYRAINNLYSYNKKINEKIEIDEVYKKLNLIQYIEEFKDIEQNFQSKIIDEKMLNTFSKPYTFFRDIKSLNLYLELKDENDKLCKQIEHSELVIKEKDNLHEQRKTLLEANEITLNNLNIEKQRLEDECNMLKTAREELNEAIAEINKELAGFKNSRAHMLVEKLKGSKKE